MGIEQVKTKFWSKVVPFGECLEYPGHVVRGTPRLKINGKNFLVHRLVYEWNVGEIPDGMVVLRSCCNSRCVNPGHLYLGDYEAVSVHAAQVRRGEALRMSSNLFWESAPIEPDPIKRFWDKVLVGDGCWEWQGTKTKGRGMYGWNGRMQISARVAWEIVHGPIPAGMHVCHQCDNPGCVNPGHLFLEDHAGNMRDKAQKGRAPRMGGGRNGCAKLTEEQVAQIRNRREKGESGSSIGADFGISKTHVYRIAKKVNWQSE